MITYISFLRGINVSGHNMIKMDALKKMFSELTFFNVQTYIQSGNIIFQSEPTNTDKICKIIKVAIEKTFGFNVPVITVTKTELETIINSNPFLKNKLHDPAFFHITFLSAITTVENREQLTAFNFKNDKYEIVNNVIYLYCPDGYSKSKLTNQFFENKLKVTATTRNWKTTNELLKLTTK